MNNERTLALRPHPDTPPGPVHSLAALLHSDARTLRCQFQLSGDIAQIRVPGARAGRRADGLWEHTCFEAFVTAAGTAAYFEFNFSPALDWAAYQFDSYRSGMRPANLAQAPGLNVRRTARRLEMSATLHLAGLAELQQARSLQVALAAVVEDSAGRRCYWALQHAPGKADFHHRAGFTCELATL